MRREPFQDLGLAVRRRQRDERKRAHRAATIGLSIFVGVVAFFYFLAVYTLLHIAMRW